jgi:UDP-N-acetylglucosamine 2-epimerase (non-hydrolysing)
LTRLSENLPILFPIHPRTRGRLSSLGIDLSGHIDLHLLDPLGYLEFLALQRDAHAVITDSGGIQEETTYLGVPCLTLRPNTERPVTVTIGTNQLLGSDLPRLEREVDAILAGKGKRGAIPELWDGHASERIATILVGG